DGPVAVNEYFARRPEMMLGEMRLQGSMYRDREPPLAGELPPARLAQAVGSLPDGIYQTINPADRARPPPRLAEEPGRATGEVKDGAYAVRDGLVLVRRGPVFAPAQVPGAVAWRIRGMLAVRDAVRVVFRTQLDDAPEHEIAAARSLLNELYD